MEVGGEPFGSDVEGQDLVDVDDLSGGSGTESELCLAWPGRHQERIADATTKTATRISQSCAGQRSKKKTSKKKTVVKKKTSSMTTTPAGNGLLETAGDSGSSSCGLEASVEQVAERFAQGCECRDGDSCFANINPESAYRHRLNIAELTRSEHDMYLMGVTMASLSNPEETARRTERKRLHTQYVFQVPTLYIVRRTQLSETLIGPKGWGPLKKKWQFILNLGVANRAHK